MTWTSRGFPLVIAAPSGAGKTTLARALVGRCGDAVFALSATTRPSRPDERHERDYRFVDDASFDTLVESDDLLEWAHVHTFRYGTLREGVEHSLASGRCVVLDIDVQGARRVRELFAEAVLVFVLPPSAAELERRLTDRGSESHDGRATRLRTALQELHAVKEFDYIVVNDDFDRALDALNAIVVAERHRRTRFVALDGRVRRMERKLATMIGGTE
jgi:guanylate kinase